MNPQLQIIVDRLKGAPRANPVAEPAVQTSTQSVFTLRQQLQRDIVNAGLKDVVTEDDLAEACDQLDVDFGMLTGELQAWL